MTVHAGRRGSPVSTSARLFVVRGECLEETFLTEVPCLLASLRARGVFLVVRPSGARPLLWLGRAAEPHQVAAGRARAAAWARAAPAELGAAPGEPEVVEQGAEPAAFWEAVGGSAKELLGLTEGDERLTTTPRCFHMTSVLGAFEAAEVRPDWLVPGTTCALLHSQATLYGAEQPALFVLDAGSVIYLWQGWQPAAETEEDNPNLVSHATGSGAVRWHAERRAAMATLLEYRRARYAALSNIPAGCQEF
jgi:hypothetical protein